MEPASAGKAETNAEALKVAETRAAAAAKAEADARAKKTGVKVATATAVGAKAMGKQTPQAERWRIVDSPDSSIILLAAAA
eukprot:6016638-Prymnesium_polylepis.1